MTDTRPSRLPKKLLVAVEGVEPSLKESSMMAARYALELASTLKAELLAVCVVQIPEYIEETTRARLSEELRAKSQRTLDEVGALAKESEVKFGSEVVVTGGAISTAICELSARSGVDLIVIGTRKNTSSLSKMMLGSVASGVASNADCPVLVVR